MHYYIILQKYFFSFFFLQFFQKYYSKFIFLLITYWGLDLLSSYILPIYSDIIQTDNNCTPEKNVTATIIEAQPDIKLFSLNIYETIAHINIIKDTHKENNPKLPTSFKGLFENPIIPSSASFNIFFNGYLVFPANLSSLSYSIGICLNPCPAP